MEHIEVVGFINSKNADIMQFFVIT